MTQQLMLRLEHICKTYDGRRVLDDISIDIGRGQAVALLGGNGTGKTTLVRIATLLVRPDSGEVLFDGHTMLPTDLDRIGYLPEERGLYRHMRVREQAIYMARLKGMPLREAATATDALLSQLGMDGWASRTTARLSKGMQQRLQLLISLVHSPSLLVLDEPFSGFDDAGAEILLSTLRHQLEKGVAILLSTHNRQAAESLGAKIVCL